MNKEVYQSILNQLQGAKLIVVSKYRKEQELSEYYEIGQRDFAENRVQELLVKKEHLPNDISWHMIGHLQSNKVKSIVPFISMIHSVDSVSLLQCIDKEAKKVQRVIPVCLQFNLAKEETKSGFMYEDWCEVVALASTLSNVKVVGIMVIGPHTEDQKEIASVFQQAQVLLLEIQEVYPQVQELSMGMSQDYALALQYGATMVRIGSVLF